MSTLITPRERQIISLLLDGLFDKEIAITLGISHQTVKNIIRNMMQKLDANSRIHAIAIALRAGEIEL